MLRVMKTSRVSVSALGQRSSGTGAWNRCCTPCTTTGDPSTFTIPLTRSMSGPRSVVSSSSAAEKACQVKGLGNRSDSVLIEASCSGDRRRRLRSPAEPSPCSASPRKLSVAGPARALTRPRPVSSAGSITPLTTSDSAAPGLICWIASMSSAIASGVAMSLLVRRIRSASAICLAGSAWLTSCAAPLTASTSVTRPSSRKCAAIRVSLLRVWSTGAGSARPVVSMMTRSKSATCPTRRRANRSRSVSCRSVRTEQQMQPLASSAMFSAAIDTMSWSMPISPISLITTATRAIAGCRTSAAMSVVLPLPRKPVISVTGSLPPTGSRDSLTAAPRYSAPARTARR